MTRKPDHPSTGWAVCNPGSQKPWHQYKLERREELSRILHVVQTGDGYRVVQIPGENGAPCISWAGSFESKAAASFFLDDLIEAAIDGNPGAACCSDGIYEHFLDIIESHEGDARDLARKIASEEPWRCEPEAAHEAGEIPF